jgi:hypothetical protein
VRPIIAALAAVTVACRAAPGPALESVNPGVVFDDQSIEVAIRGTFLAPVTANLDRPGASTLAPYEVELSMGGQVVTRVDGAFRDRRTLSALLPAGMPPGVYRLRVMDPWGKDAALDDALVVARRTANGGQPSDGGHLTDGGQPDPGAAVRVPPLPHIDAAPTAGSVNTIFAFDASGSTDTKTPVDRLEVSWDFETVDGGVQSTPWAFDKAKTSQLLPGQQLVLLRARDEDGDVGYAARRIFVGDGISPICTVTTALPVDDNAQDCSNSFGDDGKLSLDEVVRLAPALKVQVVRFDVPETALLSGSPLRITEPIRLAGTPNLTLARELVIDSPGKVRISSLLVKGPGGKIRIENAAKLDLSDSEFSDAEPIRAIGAVHVRRTIFRNCQNQCIALSGGDGSVQVSQSSFFAGAASAIAIDLDSCPPPLLEPELAAELVGNVFLGFAIAVRVGTNCARATSIVHQTFHENTVGVAYYGAAQRHVLRNNVFSFQTQPILGCGLFSSLESRRNHVLHENVWDDCLANDQHLRTDPLYASPSGGDLRLGWGSPLIDAAPVIVVDGGTVDVNGDVPDDYLGLGPDYGGRETY